MSLEAGIIVEFVVNFNDKKPESSLIFGYVLYADEQRELYIDLLHDFNDKKPELSLIFGYVFVS